MNESKNEIKNSLLLEKLKTIIKDLYGNNLLVKLQYFSSYI
jgi:hypothetical protein